MYYDKVGNNSVSEKIEGYVTQAKDTSASGAVGQYFLLNFIKILRFFQFYIMKIRFSAECDALNTAVDDAIKTVNQLLGGGSVSGSSTGR